MSAPSASVVVPTRDRPEQLAECLAALERQTLASFEVVVVDDGSTDAPAVSSVVAAAPRARLLRGDGAGPAAARNLGLDAARAAVCCFVDDDCRPESRWLQTMLDRIGDGALVVAGATRCGERTGVWATASQAVIDHLTESSLDAVAGTVAFAPTCNVGGRTDTLRRVRFDERYRTAAGEDRDWCTRLGEHGVAIAFEPSAVVVHDQRLSPLGFWRQQVRYGRGAHRWQRDRPRGERLQPASFYVGLVRRGAALGPRVGVLVVVAQVATAVGLAMEWCTSVIARGRRRRRRRRS